MIEIKITVPGLPVSKLRPRMRQAQAGLYSPTKTKKHEKLIRDYFIVETRKHPIPILSPKQVVYVFAMFFFGCEDKKKWGKLKPTRPDLDNLIKLVLDSLNKVAWADDSQVVKVESSKIYAQESSTFITISYL